MSTSPVHFTPAVFTFSVATASLLAGLFLRFGARMLAGHPDYDPKWNEADKVFLEKALADAGYLLLAFGLALIVLLLWRWLRRGRTFTF